MGAFCDPDTTTSSSHASVSSGTAPRAGDGVDDGDRPGLARRLRERVHVRDDAGGRLGVDEEHDLGAGLVEPGADVLGARRLPPRVPKVLHVCAVRGGDGRPALAELPRRDREDALAGRAGSRPPTRTRPSRMP